MVTPPQHSPAAQAKRAKLHPDVVSEVAQAIASHRVVVVGMGWNPHVKRARKALDGAGVAHTYVGYGHYLSGWSKRLAIKLWSQWPTFPQVFVDGVLLGGADQVESALRDGSLKS